MCAHRVDGAERRRYGLAIVTARALIKDPARPLPAPFADWFAAKGWTPRPHQVELLARAKAGHSTLLIAPTGAGKTLAGFLPSLVAISERRGRAPVGGRGIHTLYISPLKALAVDIARNLEQPVSEIGLGVRIETRTGDTSIHKRQRQKLNPPDILLTTPEQAALLVSAADADRFFADLDTVILDELHSLVTSKRGDLLALDLARLRTLAPNLKTIGLSATVADPDALRAWIVGQGATPSPLQEREQKEAPIPPRHGEGGPRAARWEGFARNCRRRPPPSRLRRSTSPLRGKDQNKGARRRSCISPTSSPSRAGRSRTSPFWNRASGCRGRGIRPAMRWPTCTAPSSTTRWRCCS